MVTSGSRQKEVCAVFQSLNYQEMTLYTELGMTVLIFGAMDLGQVSKVTRSR